MRSKVTYEWDMETAYDYGDIIDHNHAAKLKDLKHYEGDPHRAAYEMDGKPEPAHLRLVLVRDTWDECDGLDDREWCYLNEDGTMPDTFCYGTKVPNKYTQEFERHKAWASKFVQVRDEDRYNELVGS